MTDDVYPNDGDTITEQRETEQLAKGNSSDHVERGLGFAADFSADTLDIGDGYAVVRDGQQAWDVLPDARSGLGLTSSDVNYVYLTFDPNASDVAGSVTYEINTSQTAPSTPSLYVGTVDTSNNTTSEKNRDPLISAETVFFGRLESTPADSDIPSGTTALYYKSGEPETLYQKPDGGSESTVGGGTDTRTDIEDSGGVVVADAEGAAFTAGSNTSVSVSDDGDGTATVEYSSSGGLSTTVIDSGSTTAYTTSDEDVIYADTSSAAVTITLASADASQGNEIRVVNIDASNPVTVDTESSETIDPGAESSKSIAKAGWSVAFTSDGSNWDSSLAAEFESISTDDMFITNLGARAYLGASQTVTAGSATKIQFDATTYDDASEFDTTNHKFVASNDGRYSIHCALRWNKISTEQELNIDINKNGALNSREDCYIHGGDSYQSISISDVLDLASGDEIDIRVRLKSADETIGGDEKYSYLNVSQEG